MPTRRHVRSFRGVILTSLALSLAACQAPPGILGQPEVRCGRFQGPDCTDIVELGLGAVGEDRPGAPAPIVIAVGGACPDNARCMPSALGGETAAVVVRWADGAMDWATIPLPADWPDGTPGPAEAQEGLPPEHLQALVAGE